MLAKSDGGTSESEGEASEEHKFLSERKNWFGCADKDDKGIKQKKLISGKEVWVARNISKQEDSSGCGTGGEWKSHCQAVDQGMGTILPGQEEPGMSSQDFPMSNSCNPEFHWGKSHFQCLSGASVISSSVSLLWKTGKHQTQKDFARAGDIFGGVFV